MKKFEKYIEHCAGLYSFLAWIENETKNGIPYEILHDVIYLDPLISRNFSLGISNGKKSNNQPFFAIQPSETEWFYLIKWNKVVLRENDNYIYFISNSIFGDQEEQPDIPAFAIALYVDTKEKLLKYLETKKDPKQVGNDQRLNKQKNHIEDLLVQTKNTNPLSIKKVNISFPQSGDIESQSQSSKQPFLTGIVRNQRQIPLPGILVSIKNNAGVQIRLLKTNPHGIFATYSNLNSGVYDFEISDPKGNYFFDTMKLTIGSDQQKPLAFYSKELL